MMGNSISYNEQVNVLSESGELLGTARLVGTARRDSQGGLLRWNGQLYDPSFEPTILYEAGLITLEFNDGASGCAFCQRVDYRPTRVALVGNGMPPRAKAS